MDQAYWNNRFEEENTPWDIGYPSPAIVEYIDALKDRQLRILVPGAGNGYEVEYLFNQDFTHVNVIDLSQKALDNFSERVPDFPKDRLICGNFFNHQDRYDLIIEQTFFCALDPVMRKEYVNKMWDVLDEGGQLVGLLFNWKNDDGPPFGGSASEYRQLFELKFVLEKMELCHNSIKPRAGRELWIQFMKRIDV